jgi:hypothetical protein
MNIAINGAMKWNIAIGLDGCKNSKIYSMLEDGEKF